ncbi:hypothetical protein ACIOHC_11420 [Streptomyces sp. NPDC088252]|uniref:hypothetical protein n=1 Tax=unclassified Streptomyces TaxID=2593676 RepID=UPI0038102D21
MNAPTNHTPLYDSDRYFYWVPPLDSAVDLAREALADVTDANIHDAQSVIRAAVILEIRLRGLVAALDKEGGR